MHQGPTPEEQKFIKALQAILKDLHEGKIALSDNFEDNALSIKISAARVGIHLNQDQIKFILEQQAAAVNAIMKLDQPNTRALAVLVKDLSEGRIALSDDFEDNALTLKILAAKRGLHLNQEQIKLMLEQKGATVNRIVKLQSKQDNPNQRLAIQISLALATALWKPGIAGAVLANIAARDISHGLFDGSLSVYKNAVELALIVANFAFGDYNLPTLSTQAMDYLFETYGAWMYLAMPAAMILYAKGPAMLKALNDSKFVETASDFTDMMYGMADDETYEKYQGSLATMPIEEVASSIMGGIGSALCWLWNGTSPAITPSTYQASGTLSEPSTSHSDKAYPVAKLV